MSHDVGMTDATHTTSGSQTRTRLQRPRSGRVVAGVSSGIAEYIQVSTGLVRLAFIIATVFGGFGLLAYVAAWLFIPAEDRGQSVAENWVDDVKTPGRTTGAVIAGILTFVIIAAAIPGGTALAVALLIVGLLFARSRGTTQTN